ncbi:GAF domain-containing protein [Tsukamurella sp. 8F]|uniref:GAF domain-containing protein n=1 Tax=unclassified Tsukamurella TaxID=2633480 RepID=UPI0023B917F7|nr:MULTISPECIES: GAF domain-containing protein [unclassified Tsukamurella]MDF0531874.1 GAF domain-containing protein [Tsukamurella sp. 8J]MDF0589108.1 GAF domain-containing protein [Tsukamurella sp. 8F]
MTRITVEPAVAFGEDPRQYARLLAQVYDATMSGERPPARPREVIGDSWERVRAAGLRPDDAAGPAVHSAEVPRLRRESGLAAMIEDFTEGLAPLTEGGSSILVVADAEGRILWRAGPSAVLRQADDLGFVEGAAWAEEDVGTNAIGTALASRGAVQTFSAEHFARSQHPWTCAAAPIRDHRTGRLLGVVDVSGAASTVNPTTLALVATVARLAESRLREAHLAGLDRLRTVAAPMLAGLGRPGVAVDADGWVAAVGDLAPRSRVTLPDAVTGPTIWLPELGVCSVDPLPGGWLLQPDRESAGGHGTDTSRVVLDLRPGRSPEVMVSGAAGAWRYTPTPRHAQILSLIAADGAGRSAAQLAEALFGDAARVVTVRAEISRLRRSLSGLIAAQPYRFAPGVAVEVVR